MPALARRSWLPRAGAAALLTAIAVLGGAAPAHADPTTTSGTIRAAENGAPLSDVCIVWSPASDPGANTVLWSNGNGTFSIETEEAGPIRIGFFVPENDYDCFGAIGSDRVPSWLDGEVLSGATGMDAVAPVDAQNITPGTAGIVACLGTSVPVASADCVTPDVTLSGRVLGVDGKPVKACVFILGDEANAIGPFVTAPDGSWTASDLPRDIEFAVAFLPYFEGEFGDCADDGPPPAPGPEELQPAFLGNIWIDFTDESLFEDPRGWGIERGATLLGGTTSDIVGCLSDAPGNQVPRPDCLTALAATGPEVLPGVASGIAVGLLGLALLALGRRHLRRAQESAQDSA
jgi:hypothetical protein